MKHTIKIGSKELTFDWSIADRIVSAINPVKGVERMKSRAQMALAGQYSGASKSRRAMSDFNPLAGDANEDLVGDLPTLRARSRDLCRNSPLARGALNTNVTSVVGAGLRVKPEIDRDFLGISDEAADEFETAAARLFDMWARTPDCDITRTQNFYNSQDLVYRSALESGDVLVAMPILKRPGSPFGVKFQVIEADRLENSDFQRDSARLVGGVELDEQGAPVYYHLRTVHPGSAAGIERKWQKVRAFGAKSGRRNIIHFFDRRRPGQVRGEPYLAPVIEALKQLTRYTDAELMAAVISGMFTVFIKSEANNNLDIFQPSSETGGTATDSDYRLGNGAIVQLAPGEEITTTNPGRPNAGFDPFVLAVLRQIGVALEIPYELLIKHFTASYTAARGAILEAWRYFQKRREKLASDYCQVMYEAVITEQVLEGRLVAPGFLSDPLTRMAYTKAKWVGRPQGQLDPLKEGNANELCRKYGWKTNEEITMELTGGDWNANAKQRQREDELMPVSEGTPAPQQTGQMPPDNPDGTDLQNDAGGNDGNSATGGDG